MAWAWLFVAVGDGIGNSFFVIHLGDQFVFYFIFLCFTLGLYDI